MSKKNRFPLVMKTTALCSGLITAALAVLIRRFPQGWLVSTAITFGTVCYHFTMRLLVGSVVPRFAHRFHPGQLWFRQKGWEPKLYARLGVRNWKRDLPTYNPSQFDLRQNTLDQVIRNMCSAEAVHEVIILFSFLPLTFAVPFGAFPVFLLTSILAAMYDSIFVIAQRYNRPRLLKILNKKEAKAP